MMMLMMQNMINIIPGMLLPVIMNFTTAGERCV
jgi:hypothetical protein